jgi:hypothetical protein
MATDKRNLSALAIMIEYAAMEAALLKNKPLELILLAALKEARRSLETAENGHAKIYMTNETNELWP